LAGNGVADDIGWEVRSVPSGQRRGRLEKGLYNHWGIILCFQRGLPYKVRNFRADRVSVWEEEERAACRGLFDNLKAAAEMLSRQTQR
jgi:hypothetical protein